MCGLVGWCECLCDLIIASPASQLVNKHLVHYLILPAGIGVPRIVLPCVTNLLWGFALRPTKLCAVSSRPISRPKLDLLGNISRPSHVTPSPSREHDVADFKPISNPIRCFLRNVKCIAKAYSPPTKLDPIPPLVRHLIYPSHRFSRRGIDIKPPPPPRFHNGIKSRTPNSDFSRATP